jgi:hypothetical protein
MSDFYFLCTQLQNMHDASVPERSGLLNCRTFVEQVRKSAKVFLSFGLPDFRNSYLKS